MLKMFCVFVVFSFISFLYSYQFWFKFCSNFNKIIIFYLSSCIPFLFIVFKLDALKFFFSFAVVVSISLLFDFLYARISVCVCMFDLGECCNHVIKLYEHLNVSR